MTGGHQNGALGLRERQRHPLGRHVLPTDRHDDVLLPANHVGHRGTGRAARQFDLPHDLARLLVIGAELLAPDATPRVGLTRDTGVRSFAQEDERLGDQHRRAPALAEPGQVEVADGRMVAWALAVRCHPEQLAGIEIEGRQTPVWRLEQRQALRPMASLDSR